MSEIQAVFAKRLHDLRRTKGWSQPEVGKLNGTSGAIIGRNERDKLLYVVDGLLRDALARRA